MTRARRIGILGGTFDPIHAGHLEVAAIAHRALSLDTLAFMPSMTPAHRASQPQASAFHRFAMVALAIAAHDDLTASDDELRTEGPSYTSDTLLRLHAMGFASTELFFVLGSDAFSEITAWHGYPEVLEDAHFVVVTRTGTTLADIQRRMPELAPRIIHADALAGNRDGTTRIVVAAARTPDVSSTEIRRRVASGESLTGLTPPAVIRHIGRHGLYRRPDRP